MSGDYIAMEEVEEKIQQEDAWVVIDQYFIENGLVRQQIDSFDEFITNTIGHMNSQKIKKIRLVITSIVHLSIHLSHCTNQSGELIEDAGEILVTPQKQYIAGQDMLEQHGHQIRFGEVYVSKPVIHEAD
jgi:DNA-directed RNA polymerase beta subunit